jgi:ADP-ribosylglycohydrolase
MALSVVEVLKTHKQINQDALAQAFARRFAQEPYRGYAGGAMQLLHQVGNGIDWRKISPRLFGTGSYGNGAAMRVAPLGGYFYDDSERAAHEARLSAVVTHAHPEGQAGAIAVAVAAGLAASKPHPVGREFLQAVLAYVPDGMTKTRLQSAIHIPADALDAAIQQLGTGSEVTAQDTVPFCLWSAAYRLESFEEALWWTAMGLGDCDTTCAIVGGIVALSAAEIPALWLQRREPLPV